MQVIHRISLAADERDQRALARLGIQIRTGFVGFDVSESSESWPAVRDWIERRRVVDITHATFSAAEIAQAKWLALRPEWHHGYPQPNEDNFGYRPATYDLSDYCERCGVGLRQSGPFQMKGGPRWGRRTIMQLNWVFDEYFVKSEVWASVFRGYRVQQRPVLGPHRAQLRTVVQLVAEDTVPVETKDLASHVCEVCGRVKYATVTRGPLPPLTAEPTGHIAKTTEYFGDGARAFNEVLISQALCEALRLAGVRGASYLPVTEPPIDRPSPSPSTNR